MLDKFKYVNHMNEVVEFGANGIYAKYNDLRDYEWNVTAENEIISTFTRGIVTKTIPLIIKCKTEKEGLQIKNGIYEIFEKDILAKKYGKIIVGDYYINCFITGSSKSEYLLNKGYMQISLSMTTDKAYWIKETSCQFRLGRKTKSENGLDYPHDYPHDYSGNFEDAALYNTNFINSNFRMIIYGAVENPTLYIDGHEYTVNVSIESSEYLIIDSVNKTIKKISNNGNELNCFNLRNKDSYIFQSIKPGTSVVNWDGTFGFDVILLEERSEPKWT